VDLICPSRNSADEPDLASGVNRIPVRCFRFRGWWRVLLVWYWVKLRRLSLKSYDMLYLRMLPLSLYFSLFTKSKTPVVFELNGQGQMSHPGFQKWAPFFQLVTTDSEATIKLASEQWHVPSGRFAINQNAGIDPDIFMNTETPVPACLENMLSNQLFAVINVSSFMSHHDFDTIISALSGLGFPYKIFFFGDGPERKSVELKCLQQNIPAVFPGALPLESLLPFLRRCNLCINAFTGFAQKVGNFRAFKLYEYMASGVPTIETFDPDLPVTQWARECLGLVPYEDPVALRSMIGSVHADPESWRLKAEVARKWVFENRTWKHVAQNMLDAFEKVNKS
jgi:glycosyltransferase involved in cell wall biosynthesis